MVISICALAIMFFDGCDLSLGDVSCDDFSNNSNADLDKFVKDYIDFVSNGGDVLHLLQPCWRKELLNTIGLSEREFRKEFPDIIKWAYKEKMFEEIKINWYNINSITKMDEEEIFYAGAEGDDVYEVVIDTDLGEEELYFCQIDGEWFIAEDDIYFDLLYIFNEYKNNFVDNNLNYNKK